MTDMEMQMIRALAEIDRELGMPDDGCNSTEKTITAIRLLHAVRRDDAAEIDRLRAQRDAWKTEAEHQYGLVRASKYEEVDYPVTGALDVYAAGKYAALRVPNMELRGATDEPKQ